MTFRTIAHLTLPCLMLMATLLTSPCRAQEAGDISAANPAKVQALRAQLARTPPTGTAEGRRDFWLAQHAAAATLGDQTLVRQVIDQALLNLADDKSGTTQFKKRLWQWSRNNGGKREDIIADGEALLVLVGKSGDTFPYELATRYAAYQDYKRAQQLIDEHTPRLKALYASRSEFDQLGLEYQALLAQREIASQRGDIDQALGYAKKMIPLSDRRAANIPDTSKSLTALVLTDRYWSRSNTAALLLRAGQTDEAFKQLNDSEKIAREVGISGTEWATVLRRHAEFDETVGRFDAAWRGFQNAEAAYREAGATPSNSSGLKAVLWAQISVLIEQGKLAEARALMHKNSSALDRDRALLELNAGNLAAALKSAEKWSKDNEQRFGATLHYTVRSQALVDAIKQLQQPDPAGLLALGKTCETLMGIRSPTIMPMHHIIQRAIYESYLQAVAQSGIKDGAIIESAFQIAEAMQNSVVGEVLVSAARKSVSKQPELLRITARQSALRIAIDAGFENLNKATKSGGNDKVMASLQQELQAQQSEQLQLEKDLARRFPEFIQLTAPEAPRLSDAARQLSRGEVLVRLLPAARTTFVWVITRDQPVMFYTAAIGDEALKGRIALLRKTLDLGDSPKLIPFDIARSRALYEALLKPARELLQGRGQLIINAGGVLAQLPFGVLVSNDSPTTTPTWLIKDYAITHISSINAFIALRQSSARAAPTKTFIGFGDPLFAPAKNTLSKNIQLASTSTRNLNMPRTATQDDSAALAKALSHYDQIPPLPETRDEILSMVKALGADPQKDVFLGAAATRNAVLNASLADRQIIAFSTHGLMAGDIPGLNQPALAMAATGNPNDSPLLTLEDILGLKLNADWVVLSACNTAAADGEASEALSGLARGFFYAGARSLLVTHWAVESASAQMLMTETFKRYAANKSLSRAEALRQAQLELMRNPKYSHPFFWAPYALVGDGG